MKNLFTLNDIVLILRNNGSQKNIDGMRRFAIFTDKTYGNNSPFIVELAKKIG
jgi:hypothetical protein